MWSFLIISRVVNLSLAISVTCRASLCASQMYILGGYRETILFIANKFLYSRGLIDYATVLNACEIFFFVSREFYHVKGTKLSPCVCYGCFFL